MDDAPLEFAEACTRMLKQQVFPTDSGRIAIRVALEAAGVGRGDEVALPSFCCFGVAAPVLAVGAAPLFVDIDDTLNISLEGVAAAASPRLRAVIVPHLGGVFAPDARAIAAWARERGIFVIEDAAHALGLEGLGEIGDVLISSTGPGKTLCAPGGGFVATARDDVARAIRAIPMAEPSPALVRERLARFLRTTGPQTLLRGWGALADAGRARWRRGALVDPMEHGDGARLDSARMAGIDAVLAARQLARLPAIVERQREAAARWRRLFADAPSALVRLPPAEQNVCGKLWVSVRGDEPAREFQRFKRAFRAAGVELESAYPPLHERLPHVGRRGPLPVTARLAATVCGLPTRPNLDARAWRRCEHGARLFHTETA